MLILFNNISYCLYIIPTYVIMWSVMSKTSRYINIIRFSKIIIFLTQPPTSPPLSLLCCPLTLLGWVVKLWRHWWRRTFPTFPFPFLIPRGPGYLWESSTSSVGHSLDKFGYLCRKLACNVLNIFISIVTSSSTIVQWQGYTILQYNCTVTRL